MKKSRIAAVVSAAVVSAAALAVSAGAYNAYIGFQTTPYSFRNDWTEANYGKATKYFDKFIVWGNNDETYFPQYEDEFDYDIAGYVLPATYTDVTIDADGTYTVKAEDLDWSADGSNDFNLIFVSTDIPNDGTVTCTNAKVIVDGTVAKEYDNPICDTTNANFNVTLCNIWNADIGGYGGAFPTKSLAIEFTVTGLGGAAAEEAAPAEETAAPAAEEAAPAAGDVAAATDSTKGSPETGIADVAVVAGLAVAAGAGIALTRKRK